MNLAEKTAHAILSGMDEVDSVYKFNHEQIGRLDIETQDILHYMELKRLNAAQRVKIYNELEKVRLERRRMKNENETLKCLHDLFPKYDKFKHDVEQALQIIKEKTETQKARCYTPKIRTDLGVLENSTLLYKLKTVLEGRNAK